MGILHVLGFVLYTDFCVLQILWRAYFLTNAIFSLIVVIRCVASSFTSMFFSFYFSSSYVIAARVCCVHLDIFLFSFVRRWGIFLYYFLLSIHKIYHAMVVVEMVCNRQFGHMAWLLSSLDISGRFFFYNTILPISTIYLACSKPYGRFITHFNFSGK